MEEKKDYKRKGQTAPLTKRNNSNSRGNKTTRTNRKDKNDVLNNKELVKDTKKKLLKKGPNVEFLNMDTRPVVSRSSKPTVFADAKLKVIPLGGMNEIGKNMTVFEYKDEIIVVDCGLAFPEDDMLGVDLVIQDITYLERNKDKVKALFITHGHEDHIGAIPYFLKKINVPIYGTKLTLGLIKAKLIEHHLEKSTKLKCVKPRDVIALKHFKVEFIRMTHSIADAAGLAIKTPVGTVVHTGDFKVDYTPIDGKPMDFARLAELGEEGVTLLMSDSTNAQRDGYTMSESIVGHEFDKIFTNCKKRIIVATFASNIHRMQQIMNAAVKCNRKVSVVGRSMINVLAVSQELGYLEVPEGTIIDIDKINNYNPEELLIITTGTQGEPMSALSRMSAGEHKKVQITPDDLVIFSSSAIPGNEKSIDKVIDELEKLGAEVIYNQLADVHVSGHACKEELKLMLSLVKPKYFMPVHGEYRFLKMHGELAVETGTPKENIFIMEMVEHLKLENMMLKLQLKYLLV